MFTPIEKLTFKQKMTKWIVVWFIVMITLIVGSLILQNLRQKYLSVETPIYKTDNTMCELNSLKEGQEVLYLGKKQVIEEIDFLSYNKTLEIDFID